jgi:2-haloacid dehalogenase
MACRVLDLELAQSGASLLMEGYRQLRPFPEVEGALAELHGRKKMAILSNGSPAMLRPLMEHAGLSRFFEAIISADELKTFKPHPSVYGLAVKRLHSNADEIGFVSSNFWDISGASSFGFRTFWINRNNTQPDELGFKPVAVMQRLEELPTYLN